MLAKLAEISKACWARVAVLAETFKPSASILTVLAEMSTVCNARVAVFAVIPV